MNREYLWEGGSAVHGCLLALSILLNGFLFFSM